jgi:hypothetical protein
VVAQVEELIEQYKREFPDIDPFEDDWDWRYQAKLSLQMGRLDAAEVLLKKLIISRPMHHDGFEGLAGIYLQQGNPDAVPLIRRAYEIARGYVAKRALNQETLTEIEKKRAEIERKFQKDI